VQKLPFKFYKYSAVKPRAPAVVWINTELPRSRNRLAEDEAPRDQDAKGVEAEAPKTLRARHQHR